MIVVHVSVELKKKLAAKGVRKFCEEMFLILRKNAGLIVFPLF